MDGSVNIQDLVTMVASGKYGSEGTDAQWWEGDFNYDGLFNIVDIVAVSASGLYNSGPYQSTAMGALPAASEQVVFLSAAESPMTADTMGAIDEPAAADDHLSSSALPSIAGQSGAWSVGQLAWLALLDQTGLPSPTKRTVTFRRLGGG